MIERKYKETEIDIRIGVLFFDDFGTKGSWSVTSFYIYKTLKKAYPKTEKIIVKKPQLSYLKRINQLLHFITKRTYNFSHSIFVAKIFNKRIRKLIRNKSFDLLVAPAMSTAISYLKTDVPIIYISDTTFQLFYNCYDWFSDFVPFSIKEGNHIEKRAIQNASINIFSSAWACNSAINYYQAIKDKVYDIPFGANIDYVPDKSKALQKQNDGICRLLFIGKEWDRKGGAIAVSTLLELEKLGVKSQLSILGCNPELEIEHPRIQIFSYIDRTHERDRHIYHELLYTHHFLILPTRAECFGIVFCEANAYGLPAITTNTGGIPSVVIDGINGYKLPLSAEGSKYAKKIHFLFSDFKERYLPLVKSSRQYYDDRLNWDVWLSDVINIISNPQN